MIDLNKNQIVDPAIKCWMKHKESENWKEDYLTIIDNRRLYPYITKDTSYTICTLQNPNKKTKKWETIHDVPVELWNNVLVKRKDMPYYYAKTMCPGVVTDTDNETLSNNMHYLPKGQPLNSEWLNFESEEE